MFGRNNHGQLGLGDQENRRVPTHLKKLQGHSCHALTAGKFHSGFLDSDNQLYTWGKNKYGQCGVGSFESPIVFPKKVSFDKINDQMSDTTTFPNSKHF